MCGRTVGVLAVAMVVVLAGCGSADVVDREPYDVDDEIDPEMLPGLTAGGVTDAQALAQAHDDALETTAYRQTATAVKETENGSLEWRSEHRKTVAAGGSPALGEDTFTAFEANESVRTTLSWWIDGEETAHLRENRSGSVDQWSDDSLTHHDLGSEPDLEAAYAAVETVETVTRDGETRFVLRAEDAEIGTVENVSLELILDPDGLVETYVYDAPTLTITYTAEPLGTTDLEEPGWVAETS